MYQVSNAFIEAMKSPVQEHRITGTIGSVAFSEANIVDGSFSISNQSTDTSDVVLGSCYVGQLTAEFVGINIAYGKWINKTITPSFGLKVGEYYEYVPLGVYKVKEAKHTDHGVQVTAYDNMIKFDKKFRKSHYMNLSGMTNIIDQICLDAGVVCGMSHAQIEELPNGDRTGINIYGSTGKKAEFANDITTLRDLLFWVAQTLGCFATMNRAGQLEFRPYNQNVVDQITEQHRIAGATFADYITHYVGIYVENLDDNTEDYYGYDATALQQELTETMAEITEDQEDITDLELDRADWVQKLANHECTQEEYDAAIAEIDAQEKALTKEINQLSKRAEWLSNAISMSADDGSDMVLGANPLTMAKNLTTRDAQRREILGALNAISYTPFQASVVCGCIYDLGDVIQFSGGLYNSDTDSFGCVMSYTYTHNGGTELEGFGVDPQIPVIRTKQQKSTDRAERNAHDAKEPVHLEKMDDGSVVVRDDSILRDGSDNAGGESDRVWSFRAWAQNDIIVDHQYTWTKFKVEIKIDHNAIICDYPNEVSGQYRTADIGGKTYTDSQVSFVIKVPKDSDAPKLMEKNTFIEGNNAQSENVYTSWDGRLQKNWGAWGNWKEITYKAASVGDWDYYIANRTVGTTYAGLYGMSYPDKHYPSQALFLSDLQAGNIDPPQLANGDVVLPTDTTKKSLRNELQELANYMNDNSGDAYDPTTMTEEISPIDVESDLSEQGIINTISQIKTGVGGFYTGIENVGRGDVIARFTTKDSQTTKEIHASTNLTFVKETAPDETYGKKGDTQFVIENADGFTISIESATGFDSGNPNISPAGYQVQAYAQGNSALDYGGAVVFKVEGLRQYEDYTFSYKVRAYDKVNGSEEDPSYYEPVQRHGYFGLLYSRTADYDTSGLPVSDTSNNWYGDKSWQNFANLGKTAVSYSNTITVLDTTLYLVFLFGPLIKPQDNPVYVQISDFKSADTAFVLSDLYAKDNAWFKFAGGGGGGGITAISQASDVHFEDLASGQIMVYNALTGKWENTENSATGNAVYVGTSIPSNSLGENDDIYVQRSNYSPQVGLYKYFRLAISKNRSNPGFTQLAEVRLLKEDNTPITWSNYTAICSANQAAGATSETADKLIDGNTRTLYSTRMNPSDNNQIIITIQTTTAVDLSEFTKYGWVTAYNIAGRDPVSWTFSVSEDGEEWTVVDTVTDYAVTQDRQTLAYSHDINAVIPADPLTIDDRYIKINGEWIKVTESGGGSTSPLFIDSSGYISIDYDLVRRES